MRRRMILRALLAATLTAPLSTAPAAGQEVEALSRLVESWMASPHGDYHSPSFTYWNKDGEVPVECAACHSQPGFADYLGADGSAPGAVDRPAAVNAPIGCVACHTGAAHALDSVAFPSGETVAGLGASAVCTVCHQGRQSGTAVAAATASLDDDAVSAELGFMNIHYGVAAAVLHGSEVHGGYEYPGRRYAGTFQHVPSANTCVACHDPHTTQVATEGCAACHQGATDPRSIRTRHTDFDGDGAISGGVHAEITGLHGRLYEAIRAYAAEVAGKAIGYDSATFPYFFADNDADGTISAEEAVFPNRYASWTPRLLKAAYNYQVAAKDPGGFVHNPHYVLQLLHDSLQDLAQRVDIDTTGLGRP